ncbi:MAG TPA: UrcA family protein [Steroidobacteraceae bacterium]|nr:UrcA family protein [Steroidobacteraceae bacterium]
MGTTTRFTGGWSLLGAAALACTCLTGNVAAKDHNVTIAIPVSTQGLDLSKPDDAQTFYTRLRNAAWVACTRGTRVDLVPLENPRYCIEKALGNAVRIAKTPLVTQLYLQTHSLKEAAAQGIEIPAQVAAK